MPDAIATVGPSRPTENPDDKLRIEQINFAKVSLNGIFPLNTASATLVFGIPDPAVVGKNRVVKYPEMKTALPPQISA